MMHIYGSTVLATILYHSVPLQLVGETSPGLSRFFKNLHNEISIPSHHLPMPKTSSTRGHSQRFRQVPAHLNVYINSFFPATTKIWNSLPATARNTDDFKQWIVDYFCINPAIG